ncbi:MAG: hypothetical protein ACE5JX_08720 [Acidobacteriota bacterium]
MDKWVSNKGFAVPAALLLLLLMLSISAGMVYRVHTEARVGHMDLENSRAYYAAEAGMEKMIADLDELYARVQAPTVSQIQALSQSQPDLPYVTFSEYQFNVPNVDGIPSAEVRNITSGPNEGLVAEVVPLDLTVTATQVTGAESKMVRDVEVALIPVFQFGIFSDTDLAYHPGPNFDFGGRVHSNGNLFLAVSSSGSLTFHSKVTSAQEVIRAEMINGLTTQEAGRTGPVFLPTAPSGCDGSAPACRALGQDEGSRVAGPTSAVNPAWDNISTSTYNGLIANSATGVTSLDLPFVSSELRPVEIIRRPRPGEDVGSLVSQSRLYNQAQIRVLLSDNPNDLAGGAGDPENVELANSGVYLNGVPVSGANPTYFAEAKTSQDGDWVPASSGVTKWPLLEGYLRVEIRTQGGSYLPVTREWLELGFARGLITPDTAGSWPNTVHPDAILIFQIQADRNMDGDLGDLGETTLVTGEERRNSWFPLNLYDGREGEVRDISLGTSTSCAIGGVMNVVELDVNNLKRWLAGAVGTSGAQVESQSQNGYILYFSDRRGMLPDPFTGELTGEYGFEDTINGSDSSGAPNGLLDPAEDVNGNGRLDVYGRADLGDGFLPSAQGGDTTWDDPTTRIDCPTTGRKNRVTGTRHALKLIDASLGQLPVRADGSGGFTVASENPVYVRGNYNADASGFGASSAPAAIIADAVTLLSTNWEDWQSMRHPTYMSSSTVRNASSTWYRMAVAAGKSLPWPHPGWSTNQHYGLDGGTHNFLRFLERWSGDTAHYEGSLVNLFTSEYATGIFKYPYSVYRAPTRDYAFDTEFLDPVKLPPGTPRFRDIVNLGFQNVLTTDF